MIAVVAALQVELHFQEGLFLLLLPREVREFFAPGARVQAVQKFFVVRPGWAQVHASIRTGVRAFRSSASVSIRRRSFSLSAEGRAEQREQRLVLVDGEELAVAQRPTLGLAAEASEPDLRRKRFHNPRSPPQ